MHRFDFRTGRIIKEPSKDDTTIMSGELDLSKDPEEVAKNVAELVEKAMTAGREMGIIEERKRIASELLSVQSDLQKAFIKMSVDNMKVLFPDIKDLPELDDLTK